MDTKNLSTLKIHKLTKAQYDRELAAGRIDTDALYITPSEETDLSIYATTERVDAIDETVDELSMMVSAALKQHNNFMTVSDMNGVVLITVEDIDTICGSSIVAASEVTF